VFRNDAAIGSTVLGPLPFSASEVFEAQ